MEKRCIRGNREKNSQRKKQFFTGFEYGAWLNKTNTNSKGQDILSSYPFFTMNPVLQIHSYKLKSLRNDPKAERNYLREISI